MSKSPAQSNARLPAWLWLWFPPLLVLVIIPIKIVSPAFYAAHIDGELGLIELATPLLSILGVIAGLRVLAFSARLPTRRLRVWVLLTTLGCVYFAGEELSWGQHLFGWQTPEYFESINDQEETNLHNVSSWFDQKPRMLLELWVLVGGIIVPLIAFSRGDHHRAPVSERDWFWPPIELLPTAVLAILIRLPERIKKLFDIAELPLELRFSEPQEYYFALFLLLYLVAIGRQLRRLPNAA